MHLHLILPGLLWPDKILRDTSRDLELPALSWLLGHARRQWHAASAPEATLCRAFGLPATADTAPPYAALRRAAEADAQAGDDDFYWLCADPVHLAIEQRHITLARHAPQASNEEMQAIATALAPLLAEAPEFGSFHAGGNGRGYLRLPVAPAIHTTPPSRITGYDDLLPQGEAAARPWRRLLNEAQMALHQLPFNEQRDAHGQPRLNSLCLWGEGRLPTMQTLASTVPRLSQCHGDDALLAGLARRAGIPHQTTPCAIRTQLEKTHNNGRHLLWLPTLQAAACQYDVLRWREQLLQLETEWFTPLRLALRQARLHRLCLSLPGPEYNLELELSRTAALRFWRKPCPLHALADLPHHPT
jgi:hypothetical protein